MKTLRRLAAALTLVALLVGIPAGLWVVGADLLPSSLPTWNQIQLLLTNPLSGRFLVGALIVVGWIAWATFAVAVLVEAGAMMRGRPAVRLPALGAQQHLAAVLLAAVVIGLAASPGAAQATPTSGTPITSAVSLEVPRGPTEPSPPAEDTAGQSTPSDESERFLYTVQPGDTLWDIAATHLGEGHRWQEIADLNYGVAQPDGRVLTDAHWLEAGWQLELPIPPTTPDEPSQERVVIVEPGDTLYEIAQQYIGDGQEYPQLVTATQDLRQPDGTYLTDPDLIQPGWQIIVPGQDAATPETAPEPEPAPEETADDQTNPPSEQAEVTPAPGAAGEDPTHGPAELDSTTTPVAEPGIDQAEAADGEDQTWSPVLLQTAGGVGALLAAGVAASVMARRRATARTRPAGARIWAPEAGSTAEQLEQQLRTVADPIGREAINLALRDLAAQAASAGLPHPQVLFVRYAADGSEMQLYLTEPASLPHPWVGSTDQQVWSLTDAELVEHVAPRTDVGDVPAPYPALVGLGMGDQNTHLLIDLEQVRHLDLRGDSDATHGMLAAMLLELTTSDWADDLQVTVVGHHDELVEALRSSRVLHLATAEQALDRLRDLAHAPQSTGRCWPPEAMLFATHLNDKEAASLDRALATRPTGVAVVSLGTGLGGAAVDLHDSTQATLLPSGMPIHPQLVSPAEYGEIVTVLDAHYVPGPDWTGTLAQAREPTVSSLPTPDPTEQLLEDADQPTLWDTQHNDPHVRLLGPVELVGPDTAVLSGSIGHLHAAVEMAAYLCLRQSATANELTAALWPNQSVKPATRHSAVSRTRRLLGADANGRNHLESDTDSDGSTRYTLTGVSSDWEQFTQLRGPDPSTTPLTDLRLALTLVRGTPFSQVRDGVGRVRANRYLWSDALAVEMTASIVDVACEAARRALLEGKPRLAAESADAGLRATGDDERLWRYAILARTQMGEHAAAADVVDALTQRLTELDVDPEPETNELLDQIAAIQRQQAS